MTRFILFFLIGFFLAQQAFSNSCPAGLYDAYGTPQSIYWCQQQMNSRPYVACPFWRYDGDTPKFRVCRSNDQPPGGFDCPDTSNTPDLITCKGGRPYEPPFVCDEVGFTEQDNECVFVGCPANYVQIGQSCSGLPQPTEPGSYYCDNDGCSFFPESDLPYQNTCTNKSSNYVGDYNGEAKCHYMDESEYEEGIATNGGPAVGSCGAGRSEVFINDQRFCVKNDSDVSDPNMPKCSGDKIAIDGVCKYPPDYSSSKTVETEKIGSDGTTKTQNQTVTKTVTDQYGNSTTITETFEKSCEFIDQTWICGAYEKTSQSVESDSKEKESKVMGGNDCTQAPSCTNADAVACATLQQIWSLRCDNEQPEEDDDFDSSEFASNELAAAQSDAEAFETQLTDLVGSVTPNSGTNFDSVIDLSSYTINYTPDYGSCPADITLDLGPFGPMIFPISTYCSEMSFISTLLRFMASLIAFFMVFNTLREL